MVFHILCAYPQPLSMEDVVYVLFIFRLGKQRTQTQYPATRCSRRLPIRKEGDAVEVHVDM